MAYDETTLKNEIADANDGDIIETTQNIYLSGVINITKDITIQSAGGTLTLKNITLDGTNIGGGLSSGKSGHLILDAGSIIQNCYAHNGGALSMNASGIGISDTAVMKNGSIIQNCFGELHG